MPGFGEATFAKVNLFHLISPPSSYRWCLYRLFDPTYSYRSCQEVALAYNTPALVRILKKSLSPSK
jgi:hypothetical protein